MKSRSGRSNASCSNSRVARLRAGAGSRPAAAARRHFGGHGFRRVLGRIHGGAGHIAHSATVKGAAVIAGGPYYCAMGSIWTAYFNCMTPGPWTPLPRAALLKSLTDGFAQSGRIDATTHLAGAPVWLFSGRNDHTVLPEVVKPLQAYYALYGIKA